MRDNWTPTAIGLAMFAILVSMILDGSSPAVLIKPAPIALVFGGTFLAGMAGYMKTDLKNFSGLIKVAAKVPIFDGEATVKEFITYASIMRKSGVLELEKAASKIEDKFLKLGLGLLAGSKGSEELREILETEVESMKDRHHAGARIFADMGGYAPTFGIIGTVIGLIHVLGSLSSPNAIGPAIASAFTATLWGVLSANVMFLPLSKKLKHASDLEAQYREMQIEGILALQHGETSNGVRERMEAFLPPLERDRPKRDAA